MALKIHTVDAKVPVGQREYVRRAIREVAILEGLHHPCIVRLHEVFQISDTSLAIVMEACRGARAARLFLWVARCTHHPVRGATCQMRASQVTTAAACSAPGSLCAVSECVGLRGRTLVNPRAHACRRRPAELPAGARGPPAAGARGAHHHLAGARHPRSACARMHATCGGTLRQAHATTSTYKL